jgi:hypothetical protein
MFKILAAVSLAMLASACAAPHSAVGAGKPQASVRAATTNGESTAASLGFHGPVYRGNNADGPN